MVRQQIEIAALPEQVRKVVLDFPRHNQWHTSFIYYIETDPPNKATIEEGDRPKCGFAGTTLRATVIVNTSEEFRWYGSAKAGAFAGEHYFRFEPSRTTVGHTTFVHGEDHTGWASALFRPGWPLHNSVNKMYMDFCQDVKRTVEGMRKLPA